MNKSHSTPYLEHGQCRSMCTRQVIKVKIMFSLFSRSCRQNLIFKNNFLTSSFLRSSHLPHTLGPAALPGLGLLVDHFKNKHLFVCRVRCFPCFGHVSMKDNDKAIMWTQRQQWKQDHFLKSTKKLYFAWVAIIFILFFLTQSTRAYFIQPVAEWVGVKMWHKQKR